MLAGSRLYNCQQGNSMWLPVRAPHSFFVHDLLYRSLLCPWTLLLFDSGSSKTRKKKAEPLRRLSETGSGKEEHQLLRPAGLLARHSFMVAPLPLHSPFFPANKEVSLPKPVEYQFNTGGKEPLPFAVTIVSKLLTRLRCICESKSGLEQCKGLSQLLNCSGSIWWEQLQLHFEEKIG